MTTEYIEKLIKLHSVKERGILEAVLLELLKRSDEKNKRLDELMSRLEIIETKDYGE